MKFQARLVIVTMLKALDFAALANVISSTKQSDRPRAIKKAEPKLFAKALELHKDNPSSAARQIAFHVRSLPYVLASGAAYAIDGGIKRGQATFVVALNEDASQYGVIVAPEGSPEKTKVTDRFSGTLAEDKARTAYAAKREGQPYVPKTKGKFAVSTNGAHVNARLVSVTEYEASKKNFAIYKASGPKGSGTARKAL